MRLKALRLHGFKSFAQKSEFAFPSGLTCIVGPNGCGKSNVVDAIKWVLGEQRAKALRGSEMADVIFSGTAKRRPMGMAEVSLVFDNEEGVLGPDFAEVEIARRLYRDGTSDYLLNRRKCRLRDLRELFMDTGSGPGAMTIMEQGRIDQILREGHQERRFVFEEAAGISKYKARRKETLRRLEHVEADLLRVSDVVQEKQRSVRSLKIQAGRAERYRAMVEEMNARRLQLAVHRYGDLVRRREEASGRVLELSAHEDEAREKVRAAANECRAAEEHVETARDVAGRLEKEIANLDGRIETAREKSTFATRLGAELDGKIRWYEDEIRSSAERLQELCAERDEALATRDSTQSERDAIRVDVGTASAAVDAAIADATVARGVVADLSARAGAAAERRARLESRRSHLDSRALALEARRARLVERLTTVHGELASAEAARGEAERAETEAADAAQRAAVAVSDGEEQLTRCEAAAGAARDRVVALDRDVSSMRSRVDVLEAFCSRMEGVDEGVKQLLDLRESGEVSGVRGILADLIEADAADAALIETALGPFATALVVDTLDDAVRIAGVVEDRSLGRCTLLPLDAAPTADVHASLPDSVSTRVRCTDDVRSLVHAVLGDAVVVASLDDAVALRSRADVRAITAGGAVLEATGALSVGGHAGGAGVLQRRTELRDLTVRVEELEQQLTAARSTMATCDDELSAVRRALSESRGALRTADADRQRAHGAAQRASAEFRRVSADSSRIQAESGEVATELEQVRAESAAAEVEATELAEESRGLHAEREASIASLETAETALRQARESHGELRIALASVTERCSTLEARVRSVDDEMRALDEGVEDARDELVGCEQRKAKAVEQGEQARADGEAARTRREEAIVSLAEVRHRLSEHRSRVDERRAVVEEFEQKASLVGRELQKVRLHENEARVHVENLLERIQDELEIDLHAAWETAQAPSAAEDGAETDASEDADSVAATEPAWASPDGDFDADAVEEQIQLLRDKIGRMGAVNLEALEQLDNAEAEAEELLRQHADLTESRESLLAAIKRIDSESRELFVTTFEIIRKNFGEMFRRLFGGGKADVYLEEGADVLEAGIEMVARPPGKELRTLSLLSGGERTMTAVALLFAIYQARPSPFCLLDEVDAALDEANVERFATVVREFSEDSQFIIITHNKVTMGAAETIFGVSMPEPGVSRRLAVRLDQVGKDGEIKAA